MRVAALETLEGALCQMPRRVRHAMLLRWMLRMERADIAADMELTREEVSILLREGHDTLMAAVCAGAAQERSWLVRVFREFVEPFRTASLGRALARKWAEEESLALAEVQDSKTKS
jgi:hypothetical protein